MDLKAIGAKIAGKGLHLLGKAVPFGGGLLEMAADALNTDPTPDAVARAIDEDPEAALRLTELQNRHKERIEELLLERARLGVEAERARLADVQGARNRETEITKTTGHRDLNMLVLSWVVVGGFFALLGILIFKPLAPGSEGYINQLFGALTAGFGAVLQYFFGSSKGDSESREMIFNSTPVGDDKRVPAWKSDKPIAQMSVEELRETLRAPDAPEVLRERARARLSEVAP